MDTSKPINMAWIGASLTPQASPAAVNPAWSYYEVDHSTYSIINAQTYYSEISGAEASWNVAPFKLEYDTRKAYDPKGTWPANDALGPLFWDRYLAQAMESDANVAKLYNQYEVGNSPSEKPCTSSACIRYKKCSIQAGTAEAATECQNHDPNGKQDPN